MNISIIAPQSIGVISGGIRTQVVETTRYLPDYGIQPVFYDQWKEQALHGIDAAHLFGSGITSLDMARRLAEQSVPFVVSPVVYSNHTPGFIQTARALERVSKRFFSGVWTDYAVTEEVCRLANAVLPNSQAEADLLHHGFDVPQSKLAVIPNGVSSRFLQATPDEFIAKYGISDFILTVGNVAAPRKNLLNLLKACASHSTPLVIIGHLGTSAYGRQCAALMSQLEHVLHLEALPSDSTLLASAYAACKVFVLPSYFETPGIAAMEAGLAGANVVITPFGGPKEYFKDFAEYCHPKEVNSIRKAIDTALQRAKDAQLRQHLQELYLWPMVAKKTAEVYTALWLR